VPVVIALAPFITTRAFDEIRVDCAYNRTNVTILGIFAGLYGGPWGPTHHAIEDIALMRSLPGMTVLSAADANESARAVTAAVGLPGPAYVRLGYSGNIRDYASPFEVGVANQLRDGGDLTILAEGRAVRAAVEASDSLRETGLAARVLNMHSIKPLDVETVRRAVVETKRLITVEEHSIIGGLGSAVAEVMAEHGEGKLLRLGVPDRFTTEVMSHASMLACYGIDAEGIRKAAMTMVGGK
jgi:transketolase